MGKVMTVRIFDDIISKEQQKAVYNWSQSVTWYTKPRFNPSYEYLPFDVALCNVSGTNRLE